MMLGGWFGRSWECSRHRPPQVMTRVDLHAACHAELRDAGGRVLDTRAFDVAVAGTTLRAAAEGPRRGGASGR